MSRPTRPPLRVLARALTDLAALCLPPPLADWGRAMRNEVEALDDTAAAGFAAGCLLGALQARATHGAGRVARALARCSLPSANRPSEDPPMFPAPRALALLCAVAATALGFLYLTLAGAPLRLLLMNAGALALGLLAAALASRVDGDVGPRGRGVLVAGLAILLALVAAGGTAADGAARWLVLGGVAFQPSLIVLPVMALLFAGARTPLAAAGMAIAGLALALQPDRAMAAALTASLAAIAVVHRERPVLLALLASAAATLAAFAQPDLLPATPFVDRVFLTAFATHPVAGVAVWTGAALLLVPGLVGLVRDPANRAGHAAFAAMWLTIIVAAVAGNYPTPLVAYGGSAIVGYLLAAAVMPRRVQPVAGAPGEAEPKAASGEPLLRVAA